MIGVSHYLGGFAMLTAAACFVIQATLVRGNYGWKSRPWYNRALLALLALLWGARALGVLHGGIVVNPLWLAMSCAMATWSVTEVMRIVTESWQRKATMLELGRYVADSLHADAPVPLYERFFRR